MSGQINSPFFCAAPQVEPRGASVWHICFDSLPALAWWWSWCHSWTQFSNATPLFHHLKPKVPTSLGMHLLHNNARANLWRKQFSACLFSFSLNFRAAGSIFVGQTENVALQSKHHLLFKSWDADHVQWPCELYCTAGSPTLFSHVVLYGWDGDECPWVSTCVETPDLPLLNECLRLWLDDSFHVSKRD